MSTRPHAEVLQRVQDTLDTARLGLRDVIEGRPERRLGGLRNLVVFGRAVTNVLQNLRSIEPTFEQWYQPYVAEMRADPLLRYFYTLRSKILKEGTLRTGASVHISHFEFPRDMQRLGPPPPGAGAFFMGDQSGGSGWEIQTADGQVEKFYVDIPGDIASFEVHLPDAPLEHKGQKVADTRIETLATLYFDYLAGLVESARKEFSH
ncbi:MAG: hypothetical protein M3Z18_11405 [Gemmatimonadota bacterium]|nr:hypothetical protein [Gemmatimonadota bacterium]